VIFLSSKIRNRLRGSTSDESGLSLIEVLVAMFIFSLIAVGVAYSMINILRISSDARNHQTAANLASSAIDADRAWANVVTLAPAASSQTIDGVAYTITTTTSWINATSGTPTQCTSGAGALLAKRVHVSVTWVGRVKGQSRVVADTIVSPTTRLTDVTKGVIVVAVTTAAGSGNSGVTVTAAPASINPNGAQAITSTISPTDVNGCGIVLQAAPGNYLVSISKTASVDISQNPAPSTPVTVVAGSSVTASFQYDQYGTFIVNYHSNYTPASVTVTMPTAMTTTFNNTYGLYSSTANSPFKLHPFTVGYTVIAGALGASGGSITTCKSVDPGTWPASSSGLLVPPPPTPAFSAPGGTVTADVRMGVFSVTGLAGKYLKAVSQVTGPTGTDDPGCTTPSTYIIAVPSGAVATVALPFGSWLFTSGTSTTQTTGVGTGVLAPLTQGEITQVSGNQILTLDPRIAP
jgi:prepilin-type N-terminal cleavage/methylation domain-containing protein